jgi:hypothetical protein
VGSTGSPATVGQNQKATMIEIVKGLLSRKFKDGTRLQPEDAAAFVGNFYVESGGLNTSIEENTPAFNKGYGLAQWTGSRRRDLESFAHNKNKPSSDLDVQLDFVMHELESNRINVKKALKSETLTGEASLRRRTAIVCKSYEGPGEKSADHPEYKTFEEHVDTRYPYTLTAYNSYLASPEADSVKKGDQSPGDKLKSGNSERYGSTIVDVALSQVGQKEFPAGSNQGDLPISMVNTYIRSIGMQPGPESYWCAAFVYWVYSQLGLQNLVPKQPYTPSMWNNLNPNQRILAVGAPDVQPGDIIFYEKKGIICHVGIVTKVNATTLDTVEGNTGFDQVTRESIEVQEHKNVPITGTRGSNRIRGYGRILPLNDPRRGNSLNSVRGTGSPLVGITSTSTDGGLSLVSSSNGIANSDLANGFVSQSLTSTDSTLSYLLTGDHSLANDIPFIEWIKDLNTSSGRVFCSAPNGDFYSFFPDYFGWFNTTPYFYISDIETIDLNIQLSDQDLITHIYGIGPLIGYTQITPIDYATSPIASVQEEAFPWFIKTSTEIKPGPTGSEIWRTALQDLTYGEWDSTAFLDRYGARPKMVQFSNIRNPALLWMATWMEFMKAWAKRYHSSASFTFMPELFPGGRVNIADRIEMFVESVTHNFSYSSGFSTSASLIAPTATDAVNLDGEAERTIRSASQVSNSSPDTGDGGS